MKKLVVDIEANGLLMEATKIWCIVTMDVDTGEVRTFRSAPEAIQYMHTADKLIAHNGLGYDFPLLFRMYGAEFPVEKLVDTILISRLLLPDRDGGHSLSSWGKRVGLNKGDHTDFSQYSEEMLDYCINDVKVTAKVYNILKADAAEYGPAIRKAVELEHHFAYIISRQVLSGFKLNIDKATALYIELEDEFTELHNTIRQLMPPVKDKSHYRTLKPGQILEEDSSGYIYKTEKTGKITRKEFKLIEPNPTSRQQIVKFFKKKYRWVPQQLTEKGTPIISEPILNSLGYKESDMIARLFRIQKQMGMIKGWLEHVNPNTGRVHGSVLTNGTNTGRASHSKPNLAQVDKKDLRMREVWEAGEGFSLVGVDASGLELRLLGHYLHPYDKGVFATQSIKSKEEGDIHVYNQHVMGLNKRDSAKTAMYALVYGAGNAKLGKIYTTDRGEHTTVEDILKDAGYELRSNIEDNLTGYKKLTEDVSKAYSTRGYLNGLDGRPLHPRNAYSALNLLIQSAGAIMMKQALVLFWEYTKGKYKYDVDFRLVANVHDEIQMEVRIGLEEEFKELLISAMRNTKGALGLKVEMNGEGLIGKNWKDTH